MHIVGLNTAKSLYRKTTYPLSFSRFDEVIRCTSVQPSPPNGRQTCNNGRDVGSQCIYSCSSGYKVDGTSTRVCQLTQSGNTASWTGSAPSCTRKASALSMIKIELMITSTLYLRTLHAFRSISDSLKYILPYKLLLK